MHGRAPGIRRRGPRIGAETKQCVHQSCLRINILQPDAPATSLLRFAPGIQSRHVKCSPLVSTSPGLQEHLPLVLETSYFTTLFCME